MKFVHIDADFKHDSQQYYTGELRNLTDELVGLFVSCGWASEAPEPARGGKSPTVPEPVTLQVHNVKHDLKHRPPGSK